MQHIFWEFSQWMPIDNALYSTWRLKSKACTMAEVLLSFKCNSLSCVEGISNSSADKSERFEKHGIPTETSAIQAYFVSGPNTKSGNSENFEVHLCLIYQIITL